MAGLRYIISTQIASLCVRRTLQQLKEMQFSWSALNNIGGLLVAPELSLPSVCCSTFITKDQNLAKVMHHILRQCPPAEMNSMFMSDESPAMTLPPPHLLLQPVHSPHLVSLQQDLFEGVGEASGITVHGWTPDDWTPAFHQSRPSHKRNRVTHELYTQFTFSSASLFTVSQQKHINKAFPQTSSKPLLHLAQFTWLLWTTGTKPGHNFPR